MVFLFLVTTLTSMLLTAYYCCWFVVLSGGSLGYQCRPVSSGGYCPPGHCTGRLRFKNGCTSEPIWIANQGYRSAFLEPQMAKLDPGQIVAFDIPTEGLVSTRFWPLARCGASGSSKHASYCYAT